MRFFGFIAIVLTALGCSSTESSGAATDDASACRRVTPDACCEGEIRTYASSVDGIPCSVLTQCRDGHWTENRDDCFFKKPRCPANAPEPDARCAGPIECTYPCDGGSQKAACIGGFWSTSACASTGAPFGAACVADGTCVDETFGVEMCATWLPDPVCLAWCAAPSTTTPILCGSENGVCSTAGRSTPALCLPRCTFDETSAPTGCTGANRCAALFVEKSGDALVGTGACSAGCRTNADCGGDRTCQPETGLCMAHVVPIAKPHGAACTRTDLLGDTTHCPCHFDLDTEQGYCANVCDVGADACPTGSTCDPLLPGPDDPTPFPSAPPGLLGRCLKTCTTDDDCAPLGAKCRLGGGMTTKTCRYDRPSVY